MDTSRQESESEGLLKLVIHDVSTPITISQVLIKRLKRSALFQQNQKEIESLEIANETVINVLTQVRLMVTARNGKMPLHMQSFRAVELCENAIKLFENVAEAKNIKLRFDYVNAESLVLVEPSIFKTAVLGNLLNNAIKFSKPNSIIQIGLYEENDWVVFEVQDFGIGIPPELMTILFDPNLATHRPGTNGESGSGLGLPLMKKFVELMDGKVELQSFPESQFSNLSGSIFKVYLPRVM